MDSSELATIEEQAMQLDYFILHVDESGNIYRTYPVQKHLIHSAHKAEHADNISLINHLENVKAYNNGINNDAEVVRMTKRIAVLKACDDFTNMSDEHYKQYIEADIHHAHRIVRWDHNDNLPEDKSLVGAWVLDDKDNIVIDQAKAQKVTLEMLKNKMLFVKKQIDDMSVVGDDITLLNDKLAALKVTRDTVKDFVIKQETVSLDDASLSIFKSAMEA